MTSRPQLSVRQEARIGRRGAGKSPGPRALPAAHQVECRDCGGDPPTEGPRPVRCPKCNGPWQRLDRTAVAEAEARRGWMQSVEQDRAEAKARADLSRGQLLMFGGADDVAA